MNGEAGKAAALNSFKCWIFKGLLGDKYLLLLFEPKFQRQVMASLSRVLYL